MHKHSSIKSILSAAFCALAFSSTAIAQTTATPPPEAPPAITPLPVPPAAPTPPPLPPVLKMSVFVVQNGVQAGPFGSAELTNLAKSGALKADTMVWQEGMAAWAAASTVPELAALLTANTPAMDAGAFLAGSWTGSSNSVPIPGLGTGDVTMTTVYNSDLSMTAFGTIAVNTQNGPLRIGVTMQGTFTAQMLNPTTILITPNVRVTLSTPGQPPIENMDTSPIMATILSPTSIRDDDGVIYTKQ